MQEHPLARPDADPLAAERGSKAWTSRRFALLAAGALGAAAFAFGALHMAAELRKPAPEAAAQAERTVDAATP